MKKFEANDRTRGQALEELIFGSSISDFSIRHGLMEDEVVAWISGATPLTRTIGITLAVRLKLPLYYFEEAVPYAHVVAQRGEVVPKNQYKPNEKKRLAVLKELIGATSASTYAYEHDINPEAFERYVSGAIKLDKPTGRKLALKLSLPLNYFDITQPKGSVL